MTLDNKDYNVKTDSGNLFQSTCKNIRTYGNRKITRRDDYTTPF